TFEMLERGNKAELDAEVAAAAKARQPVYDMVERFKAELRDMSGRRKRDMQSQFKKVDELLHDLLGPFPGEPRPVMPRSRYGKPRWDRAEVTLDRIMTIEDYDYSDPTQLGKKVLTPRVEKFRGTALEGLFTYLPENLEAMMHPRWTFYWRFLTDEPVDASIFGGIWPALLGTIYLTLGAMVFAVPMGVITAIYLVEYAGSSRTVSMLRTFVSTLAGVPSIVFGLFGLAFFLNTLFDTHLFNQVLHISKTKTVLAGSMTLALLVLPTIIRAAEEAIRAVPHSYKEAALSLGATRWRTVVTVILPASLPGVLTGIIISMGRAAGETAPIIFTAAVALGKALSPTELHRQPTPALPWNIYNLCSENQAIEEIRHVQYGMVLVLVGLVLLLNVAAILLRARIAKKLRG
ncbi:MAG: phosphate ABC transporter permease PstA, partial [Planctomycetes bacterium]|nr:phosphate ABC transporter permease PstA [Planctomycetota bacterium]